MNTFTALHFHFKGAWLYYAHAHTHTYTHAHTYIDTYIHTYIHMEIKYEVISFKYMIELMMAHKKISASMFFKYIYASCQFFINQHDLFFTFFLIIFSFSFCLPSIPDLHSFIHSFIHSIICFLVCLFFVCLFLVVFFLLFFFNNFFYLFVY